MSDEAQSAEPPKPLSKISDRIRKLLTLSKSDNPNEAASAAAQVQALMQEHKLSSVDVEAAAGNETDVTEIPLGAEGFMADWKFALVSHVARAFFCEAIGLRVKRRRKVRIVGRREDAQTAVSVFTFLVAEIERLSNKVETAKNISDTSDEEWDGVFSDFMEMAFGGSVDIREYREQWRQGAAEGASNKLKEQMARFAARGEKALMVVNKSKEVIEQHLASKYPKTTQRQVIPKMGEDALSALAYQKGYATGQKIELAVGPKSPKSIEGK